MVVILIVGLVSAATLPVVLPALNNRQVGESARILQAALAGARDAAIKANAPRGIRLLPDLTLTGTVQGANGALVPGQSLAASRIVPIEPAPDLVDSSDRGSATFVDKFNFSWASAGSTPPPYPFPLNSPSGTYPFPVSVPNPATGGTSLYFNVLIVAQAVYRDNTPPLPNPPTNWFWNVRVGDRFRSHDSGRYYFCVGPMTVPNPEGFVNDGLPDATPSLTLAYGPPAAQTTVRPEFLFLVNGADDPGVNPATGAAWPADGFVDNGMDGLNVNPPTAALPAGGPSGSTDDVAEWVETETWLGSQGAAEAAAQGGTPFVGGVPQFRPVPFKWVIARRPVPSPGAREVSLPAGSVIDLTTWESTAERSRLPVDRYSGAVDVMLNQAGQIVPTTTYSSPSSYSMAGAFLHFWIADRRDVVESRNLAAGASPSYPMLPVGPEAANLPATPLVGTLKNERYLLTLFARTGAVVTNPIENFDYLDGSAPYREAQLGIRGEK